MWEKILEYLTDKCLISIKHKELLQIKTNNPKGKNGEMVWMDKTQKKEM